MKHTTIVRLRLLGLAAVMLTSWTSLCAQKTMTANKHVPSVSQWIEQAFAKGKTPPFSFFYDNKPSADFITKWTYTATRVPATEADEVDYTFTYTNPADGLCVTCDVKGYPKYNSVEWVLRFMNKGKGDTKAIKDARVINLDLKYGARGAFKLNYLEGNQISTADFRPQETTLTSAPLVMKPEGGRSSQGKYLPFFCVSSPQHTGFILSVGWTGTWRTTLQTIGNDVVHMDMGQNRFDLYLHAQESVRTPSVNLMFWEGQDYLDGTNKFRRLVQTHCSRKIDGKTATYPLSTGFNYGDPQPLQEYSGITQDYAISMVRRNDDFGLHPEAFWLDAGWHQDASLYQYGLNWANTTGNWAVDTTRFGKNMRPLADEIHRHGAKFMVWFEPERAIDGTQWCVWHYDWMLRKPKGGDWLLFDLANPKAVEWLCHEYGDMIEDNGIDIYRQDANIEPDGYWEANEEPQRKGLKEAHYIEGLYRFWDYLLQRFPHLLIDNCASGGRRIDWETTRRSAPLWQSDYWHYGDVDGLQTQNYGLNTFLPFHGTGVAKADAYDMRSAYSSALVFHWKLTSRETNLKDVKALLDEYKRVRPYYLEDYYPLTGWQQATQENAWLAYQLNRPSEKDGIVVAFRRGEASDSVCTVKLRGLEPNVRYYVTNEDSGQKTSMTGKELADGLTLALPQPRTSLLLAYTTAPQSTSYLKVNKPNKQKLIAMGAEFDPHFLSQNVTRSEGCKAEDWDNVICRRVKEMQIQRFRIMVLPQWYEPVNDDDDPHHINWSAFTWDSPEMKSLLAELDLAERLGIQVNLTLWGAPEHHFLAEGNYGDWVIRPTNYDEWAENFSAIVQYLINERHYTCIKEITPVNEPDWAYIYKGRKSEPEPYIEMCKILDKRFRDDGIRDKVHFSLADNSDGGVGTHFYLQACTQGLADIADIFNSHTYIFGYETPNSYVRHWEDINCQLANKAGKPHFIGEYGGNQCVGSARQLDINLYERGVLMVRTAINCLNSGAAGMSYWSLIDQYYGKDAPYSSMQQLGLWKSVAKAYAGDTLYADLKTDYEPRPQYYAYSLLTRFVRPNAEIFPIDTDDEFYAGMAVKNDSGQWVYVFANGNKESRKISLANSYVKDGSYAVYRYVRDGLPADDSQIQSTQRVAMANGRLDYVLPAESVVLFTQEPNRK